MYLYVKVNGLHCLISTSEQFINKNASKNSTANTEHVSKIRKSESSQEDKLSN